MVLKVTYSVSIMSARLVIATSIAFRSRAVMWAFLQVPDPGDFRMITIENASGQYRFKNYDWVYEELFDNNLFYCHQVDKSRYLLFLRCFTYGCCAGVLTVLAIDETGARVVYNQECKLDDLNKDPFSITIESDYPEGVSKYETHYYPAYNLFVEDGALKMKSVELLRE